MGGGRVCTQNYEHWGGGGSRECAHKIRRMYDMSVHIKLGACTTWGGGERVCTPN